MLSECLCHVACATVSVILAVGLPGHAISMARCSSLSHYWAVTLPEVVPSLLKKLKWPHHLSELWTTLSPVQQADWYMPQVKRCLAAHPMRADEIPLKRHTDTCCGIATYIARPLVVPTQEEYWYLPWHCCPYHIPTCCAHSRGILIRAVVLLLILSPGPLYTPLKWHLCQLCGLSLKLSLL